MVGKEALNVYPHPILQCCKWEITISYEKKIIFPSLCMVPEILLLVGWVVHG